MPLNLADTAAIVNVKTKPSATWRPATTRTARRSCATARAGLVSNETPGTVSVIDLARAHEGQGHPGRRASLPPGGDRARPARRPRLRRDRQLRPGRGDRHEAPRGRAHAVGRAARRARHVAGRRRGHARRRASCSLPRRAPTSSPSSRSPARAGECLATRAWAASHRGVPRRRRGRRRQGGPRLPKAKKKPRRDDVEARRAAGHDEGHRRRPRSPRPRRPTMQTKTQSKTKQSQADEAPARSSSTSPARGSAPARTRTGPQPEHHDGLATTASTRRSTCRCSTSAGRASPTSRPTASMPRADGASPTARCARSNRAAARPPDTPLRAGRADQARLLHRAREPHLRPDPGRRRARRRRPQADALRRAAITPNATRSPSASRCSTTSTRTPRPRSTATSGRARRRSPTTSTRPGSRTTAAATGPTTSASTRSPGRSNGFLFDQAERQGISYFNYGEAVAGRASPTSSIPGQGPHRRGAPRGQQRSSRSPDLGAERLLPERRLGRQGRRSPAQDGLRLDAPAGGARRRLACRASTASAQRFTAAGRDGTVPAFNYLVAAPTTTREALDAGRAHPDARWSPTTTGARPDGRPDLALVDLEVVARSSSSRTTPRTAPTTSTPTASPAA